MPGETYGSMLRPGVGTSMLSPTAPVTVVTSGAPVAVVRAAPPCRLIESGIRLPPMARNATSPPIEVALLLAPDGFQLEIPAARFRLTSPREARAPKAFPPPTLLLGLP